MKLGRLLAGALLAVPLLATWFQPFPAWWITAVPAGLLLLSAWRPLSGALLLAGLAPLASWINMFVARPWGGSETAEILILSVLSGAWMRLALDRPSAPTTLGRPATLLALIAGTSAIVLLAVLQLGSLWLPEFMGELGRHVARDYFIDPGGLQGLHRVTVLIEGLLVATLFERLATTNAGVGPRLLRMLIIGAAGAAVCSVYRLAEISLRTATPIRGLVQVLYETRVAPLYGDINAAGSYFALMAIPAAMLWADRRRRLRGTTAVGVTGVMWTGLLALVVLALGLTHSRGAYLAVIAGGIIVLAIRRVTRRMVLAIGATVVIVLAVVAFWNVRPSSSASPADAFAVRVGMATVSLRMAADHPVFGVGIGEFQPASVRYVDPELARLFPPARGGENAHNNFLQILGELGLAGFAAFAWLLWTSLAPALRRMRVREETPPPNQDATPNMPLAAATGGILAFLISCLFGHPLLTPQVSWAFFAMLGLTAGLAARREPASLAASTVGGEPSRRPPRSKILIAAATMLVVVLPYRVYVARAGAQLDHLAVGVASGVMAEDGVSYQLADRHSAWFVSARARFVELPLRFTAASVPPCRVEIAVDGRPGNIVAPTRTEWSRVTFGLVVPPRGAATYRIDLRVMGDECHVMVGHLTERE